MEVIMKISKQLRTDITGYLFIAPNIIVFLLFTIIPIIFSLIISFSNWDYTQGFSNINFNKGMNYINMWKDEWFTKSLINTVVYSVTLVPITVFVALIISVLVDRYVIGKTPVKLALFMPYISNIVAVSIVWVVMYSPYGPITQFFKSIGIKNPPQWLGDPNWSLLAIIIMSIWAGIGYAVLIYTSAIQSLPEELYEAAKIDGATGLQRFIKITIPMLSPTTFFLITTTLIGSFQVFGQIYIMTKGGPGTSTHVLVYYIYTSAFTFFKMGYAASMSWILFIILFLVTIVQWKFQEKWVNY
jgi:multiple sugar transport system permease protein